MKLLIGLVFLFLSGQFVAAQTTDVQAMLDQGQFDEAEAQLQARLAEAPDDHDARLALGVTTFLHGIEEFSQTTYRFGVRDVTRDFAMMGPGFSLPIRPNPDPEPVAADDVVAMFERFAEALAEVDAILEPIGDQPAKMTLRLGTVRMDLNADGEAADDENLWRFVEAILDPPQRDPWMEPRGDDFEGIEFEEDGPNFVDPEAEGFVLGLDTADAYWLRGYCNVMGGVADVILAYDGTELFNRTGHLFFENPTTPYPWLVKTDAGNNGWFNEFDVLDFVALFHLLNQPLRDADRMAEAHAHFKQVVAISRLNWSAILAETDDFYEWVPSPDQTGVLPMRLTAEQIDSWMAFLDEADRILDGETLIPFWRGGPDGLGSAHPTLGVNLKRVFTEPTPFDLMLWFQGTAAQPYLEEGPRTQADFWQELNREFGRNFLGFSFWIN
ncbi:MAG: tetratricopeptide repeat protein [Planctomycetota bacterium]